MAHEKLVWEREKEKKLVCPLWGTKPSIFHTSHLYTRNCLTMQLSPKALILTEQEHFTVSEWQLLKVLTLEAKDSRGILRWIFPRCEMTAPDIKTQARLHKIPTNKGYGKVSETRPTFLAERIFTSELDQLINGWYLFKRPKYISFNCWLQ